MYTRNRYLTCQFCWRLLAWSGWNILTTLAEKYIFRVFRVQKLLMMDSGVVRNMQSTLSHKSEKQCISLAFIVRIHHEALSSECQIKFQILYPGHKGKPHYVNSFQTDEYKVLNSKQATLNLAETTVFFTIVNN